MQVYPEPPRPSAITSALSTVGNDHGRPEAVHFASQPFQPPPPPAYAPPAYQPPTNAYGFNPSFVPAHAPYGAPPGYGIAPASHGYPVGPAAPPTQLQNNQNVQLNVMHATASPLVVAQPAPMIMSPPSYLGWSIFNFLCCFWPLGLAAMIYSVKVGSARSREDAKSYSLKARNLNIAATTVAPILVIVFVGAVVGNAAVTSNRSSYYSDSYYSRLVYYSYDGTYSYSVVDFYYNTLSGIHYYKYTTYAYKTFSTFMYVTGYYYG